MLPTSLNNFTPSIIYKLNLLRYLEGSFLFFQLHKRLLI